MGFGFAARIKTPGTPAQVELLSRVLDMLRQQEGEPEFWMAECLRQLAVSPEMSLKECVAQANTSAARFSQQKREKVEEERWKALMDAVGSGNVKQAKIAVKDGADVNRGDHFVCSETALNRAARRGDLEMVKFLLSVGADASGPDPQLSHSECNCVRARNRGIAS